MSKIRGLSLGLCLAVLFSTPFERLGPVLALPNQNLTNLELSLALAIGVWALSALISKRWVDWRTPVTGPWILLLLIMLASTLLAPAHRDNAVHFTGRCLAGFLFFLAVSDLADSRRAVVWMLSSITAAGTLVGALGVLEFLRAPGISEILAPFQTGPNYAVGQERVSSTLQYSTIASMYLEIAFALGMGLFLLSLQHRKTLLSALLLATQTLIGSCVILTLTRGGLLVLVLTLGLAATVCHREWGVAGRTLAVAALGVALSLVAASTFLFSQEARLRLVTVDQRDWYKARYEVPETLYLRSGELRRVDVGLANTGLADWLPGGKAAFGLAYHWLTEDGSEVVDWEGLRTELPKPVRPGGKALVSARLQAPMEPGDYVLAWDLLQENHFWFSKESSPSAFTRVEVRGEPLDHPAYTRSPLPASRLLIRRGELWRTAFRLLFDHPWLGVGPDNFRLVYGRYLGLKTYDLTYHTHSLFLEFFADTGISGGLVFLWILWKLASVSLRNWRQSNDDWYALTLGVGAAALAILAHGFFDYFLEFTPTYLLIFTVFALAMALNRLVGRRELH